MPKKKNDDEEDEDHAIGKEMREGRQHPEDGAAGAERRTTVEEAGDERAEARDDSRDEVEPQEGAAAEIELHLSSEHP